MSALGWLIDPPRVQVPESVGRVVLKLNARAPSSPLPQKGERKAERKAEREAARAARMAALAAEREARKAAREARRLANEAARRQRSVERRAAKRAVERERREAERAAARLARAEVLAAITRKGTVKQRPSPVRTPIVRALVANPKLDCKGIAQATGLGYGAVASTVSAMKGEGWVVAQAGTWPTKYVVTRAAVRVYGGAV